MKFFIFLLLSLLGVNSYAQNERLPKCYSNVVNGIVREFTIFEPKTIVKHKLLTSSTSKVDVWDAPRVAFDYNYVELVKMKFEVKVKKPSYNWKTYYPEFEFYAYNQPSYVVYDNNFCSYQSADYSAGAR